MIKIGPARNLAAASVALRSFEAQHRGVGLGDNVSPKSANTGEVTTDSGGEM